MKHSVRGVLTVFFTLLATVFLGLIFMLIESARVRGARARVANITEMGNYSLFGGYEKQLLTDYEIFAVDAAEGTGDFSIKRLEDRLKKYYSWNTNVVTDEENIFCFDPWRVSLGKCTIKDYALLTDDGCENFYQQVLATLHETAITQILGKLTQYYQDSKEVQEKQETYTEEKEAAEKEFTEMEKLKKAAERETEDPNLTEEEKEKLKQERKEAEEKARKMNPIGALWKLFWRSTLKIVSRDLPVSNKSVWGYQLCSKRWSSKKGNMKMKRKYGGFTDDLLFREYLLDHFDCFTVDRRKNELDYELEYILCGSKRDKANLKETAGKMLLIREGCNYAYLLTDEKRSGEVEALAFLLTGWTGIEALPVIVKHIILVGWAYGESMLDVRILFNGGKVPLDKSEGGWHVELEKLKDINKILDGEVPKNSKGFSYKDYLRLLLYLGHVSEQKVRAVDMLELSIRGQEGLSNSHADHMVVALRDENSFTIKPLFSRVTAVFLGLANDPFEVNCRGGYSVQPS